MSDKVRPIKIKRHRQGVLAFPDGWGGKRKRCGRKPKGEEAGIPHRERERLASRFPVHVTIRLKRGLPSLRRPRAFHVVRDALAASSDRFGFRLNQYSVQSNHLHLVVEANDSRALSRGMKGLGVRLAMRLNRLWGRSGALLSDRYHAVILRTPRHVRNVLAYVLNNCRRHGIFFVDPVPDPFSSGSWFDGWRDYRARAEEQHDPPVVPAGTYLQRVLWRRHGLLLTRQNPGRA